VRSSSDDLTQRKSSKIVNQGPPAFARFAAPPDYARRLLLNLNFPITKVCVSASFLVLIRSNGSIRELWTTLPHRPQLDIKTNPAHLTATESKGKDRKKQMLPPYNARRRYKCNSKGRPATQAAGKHYGKNTAGAKAPAGRQRYHVKSKAPRPKGGPPADRPLPDRFSGSSQTRSIASVLWHV
jgi:hypothetical protein